ncbi:MAG: hypothetical protein QME94_03220, partial [Anaerolineae bacterium]|nr:hypothetical protein [Anaerolineae bacterium]
MLRKAVVALGAAVLVGALGLFAVGTVFAQEPTPTPGAKPPWPGPWGRICRGAGILGEAITDLLGMTREEIYTERAAGKTLSQIAGEKGVSDQQLIDAMLAAQKERIDEALKEGRITLAISQSACAWVMRP